MATVKGGEKAQKYLDALARKLKKGASLKVGFLAAGTYPDGTSIPLIAAINEFGRPPVQPPRPFFRSMVKAKSPGWPAAAAKILPTTGYDAEKTMKLMGEGIKGQLQESIRNLWSPPLAPSTVAKKGFDKPLIEHSIMLNSVEYEVNMT